MPETFQNYMISKSMLCIETPNISHYYLYNAVILSGGFLLENPSHLDLFGSSFWHGIIWCVHQDLTWHLTDVVVERKDFAFTMFGFYISVFISSIRKTFERIFLVPNWILVYEEPFHTYLFCLLTENPTRTFEWNNIRGKYVAEEWNDEPQKYQCSRHSRTKILPRKIISPQLFDVWKSPKEKTFHFNHFSNASIFKAPGTIEKQQQRRNERISASHLIVFC